MLDFFRKKNVESLPYKYYVGFHTKTNTFLNHPIRFKFYKTQNDAFKEYKRILSLLNKRIFVEFVTSAGAKMVRVDSFLSVEYCEIKSLKDYKLMKDYEFKGRWFM